MGNRLSKIVTKTGDNGTTGIANGVRLLKSTSRIHAIGDIDELNCQIGVCMAHLQILNLVEFEAILLKIQHHLFDAGAQLSLPEKVFFSSSHTQYLDDFIEKYNATLPALKEFILPSGALIITEIHLARAICRRAERSIIALHQEFQQNTFLLQYINRLSDWLFILTRTCALKLELKEVYWQHQRK